MYFTSLSVATLAQEQGASSDSGTNWGLVAAITSAAVAVAALLFREWQQRQDNLSRRVQAEVSSAFGATLKEFRDIEADLREKTRKVVDEAIGARAKIEELLESSHANIEQLQTVLGEARSIIPEVDKSRTALPSHLLFTAQTGGVDTGLAALAQILSLEGVTSTDCEIAGDRAQVLRAYLLARDLYSRSVKIDPNNATAAASLLFCETMIGSIDADTACQRAADLIRHNLGEDNVVSEALNVFHNTRNYSAMNDLIEEMVAIRPSALLLRNLALAQQRLGEDDRIVIDAYEKALTLAAGQERKGGYVNTARPYVSFLIGAGQFHRAGEVLEDALTLDPLEDLLLMLYTDLHIAKHDYASAAAALDAIDSRSIDPVIKQSASRRRREIAAVEYFVDVGILPRGAMRGAVSTDDHGDGADPGSGDGQTAGPSPRSGPAGAAP